MNYNFFTTEISVQKTRPYTTGKIKGLYNQDQTLDAYAKMKQIKLQLKKADQQYHQALSSAKKTRASIDKANRNTQITRINFLKVYQTKKLRLLQKNLLDDFKDKQKAYHLQNVQKARKIKLQSQLQSLLMKNQEQQNLQIVRMKNRRQKEAIRKQMRLKKNKLQQTAKKQYQTIKNAHTQLLVRRKKVQLMLQARAKHNYMAKINKQIQLLVNYNNLAKQIGQIKVMQEQLPQKEMSKSFFITRD